MMINADKINYRCSAGKYTLIDTFGDTHLQKNSDELYITPYSSSLPLIFSKSDSSKIKIQLKCTDTFDILTNNTSGNNNPSKHQDVNNVIDNQYIKIKKDIIYIMVGCACLVLIVGMVISGLWRKKSYHNQLVRQQANMMEATNSENL